MAIIRGTTPTLTFRVKSNLDLTEIAALWITFRTMPGARQREKTFTLTDVSIEGNNVILALSQADTLSFGENLTQIQMRLRMNDGMAYASGIIETCIGRILKEGVI